MSDIKVEFGSPVLHCDTILKVLQS